MANVIIDDTHLSDIADAIRGKNGSLNTYTPAQMAAAISAIETGGSKKVKWLRSDTDASYTYATSFTVPDDMKSTEQILFLLYYWRTTAKLACPFYIRDFAQYQINSRTQRYWMPIGQFPNLGATPTTNGGNWIAKESNTSFQGDVLRCDQFLLYSTFTFRYSWRTLKSGTIITPTHYTKKASALTDSASGTSVSGTNRIFVLYEV